MACEFGYRLTGKAEADLDNILSYMAVQLANSQAAAAFLEKFQAAISEACLFPESDSPVDNAFLPCKIIRKKQLEAIFCIISRMKRRKPSIFCGSYMDAEI